MKWYLGLDVGTTNIKANAFCLDTGTYCAGASVPTPQTAEEGGCGYAYAPDALFSACCTVLRRVVAQVPQGSVRAIAVSSMAESGILLDRSGRPLCNAIPWFDARSLPQADALAQRLGRERIYQITGQICSSKFGLTKLLWLKENRSACFSAAQTWLSVNDYILYRLSGQMVSDYSIAARTMAFDIRRLTWSREILCAAEVPRTMFPPAVPGGTEIGLLLPEVAAELGLSGSVTVVTGGHDHACAAVGGGATVPGTALDSMGTSEVTVFPITSPVTSHEMYLAQANIYPHCSETLYRALTSMQACGASMTWFLHTIGQNITEDAKNINKDPYLYLQEVAEACEECPQLQYFPFLRGSLSHPDAGGVFLGFHDSHGVAHFAKALLDGLCCEFAHQVDVLCRALGASVDTVSAVGGPSQSPYLMRRKAAIAGLTVRTPAHQEAASFGAALLAAVGCGDRRFASLRQDTERMPVRASLPEAGEPFSTIFRTYQARRGWIEQCFSCV